MSDIDDAQEFVRQTENPRPDDDYDDEGTYRSPLRGETAQAVETAIGPKPGQPCQYSIYGPGYKPTSQTIKSLRPGAYDLAVDQHGVFAIPAMPPTGLLLDLPEMRSDDIIRLVDVFWESEKDYKEGNEFVIGGAAYRAGIMVYGPPGSGKSCTLKLLSRKLIDRGGTVFFSGIHPTACNMFLTDFTRIEKDRKAIVILEDFDSLLESYSESGYLEMLDSAKAVNNVLFIATTNYPERLDPRIYNRPGRFSHVVRVGMPTPVARAAFLKAILKNHRDVEEIVKRTDGFSVDHLSALVNAVYREKKELNSEIERLRLLFKVPKCAETGTLGIGT